MTRLEQTIQTLDRRVRALESQLLGKNAPVSVTPDNENWRKQKRGMKKAEVKQILGSPTKLKRIWSSSDGFMVAHPSYTFSSTPIHNNSLAGPSHEGITANLGQKCAGGHPELTLTLWRPFPTNGGLRSAGRYGQS